MSIRGVQSNGYPITTSSPGVNNNSETDSTGSARPSGKPLPLIKGQSGLLSAASSDIPTITDKTQDIKTAQTNLDTAKKTLADLEIELEKVQQQVDDIVAGKEAQIEKLEAQLDTLESLRDPLQEKADAGDADAQILLDKLLATEDQLNIQIAQLNKDIAKQDEIQVTIQGQDGQSQNATLKGKQQEIDQQESDVEDKTAILDALQDFAPGADLDGDGISNQDDPDSDGDGLTDDIEDMLGLDKNNIDSDHDGVSDIGEIILSLEGKSFDSAALKKVLDAGKNPFDGWEYNTKGELVYNAAKKWKFNPLNADSDGDGFIDKLEVKANYPAKYANMIFTKDFGKTSGSSSGGSGDLPSGPGVGGASDQKTPANWTGPGDDFYNIKYDDKDDNGNDLVKPYSAENIVFRLSDKDEKLTLEKSNNDLVITTTITDPKTGKQTSYKVTCQNEFDSVTGKMKNKLYIIDKGGNEIIEYKGLKPEDVADVDEWGNVNGGLYLSNGSEGNTSVEGWGQFNNDATIDDVGGGTEPPANPFEEGIATLTSSDKVGTDDFKTFVYDVNVEKGASFTFPEKFEGQSINKFKFQEVKAGSNEVICDILGDKDKIIGRIKLNLNNLPKGVDAATEMGNGSLSFIAGDNGQYIDAMALKAGITIDGGAGDDLIKLYKGKATGGTGNDMIVAGDGGVTMSGDEGDDVLLGGNAKDIIDGGDGWDFITSGGSDGGSTDDEMHGGAGNDVITTYAASGNYIVDGGDETDFSNVYEAKGDAGNGKKSIEMGLNQLANWTKYLTDKIVEEKGTALGEYLKSLQTTGQYAAMASGELYTLAMSILNNKVSQMEGKFGKPHEDTGLKPKQDTGDTKPK